MVGVPDIANFTFTVITEGGKDLAALQKDNISKTNAAIDYLGEQGVDKKDISTQSYNIGPRYDNLNCFRAPCPAPTITGYTINQTVSVKVRDLEKVGTLISGVVTKGANSTFGPNFTVDDPSELRSEARAKAIAQAKEQAEAVAEAGGFRLGRLIAIEEGGYPQPFYAMGKGGGLDMDAAREQVPAPTIEPGSQDVVVNVILRYEIN